MRPRIFFFSFMLIMLSLGSVLFLLVPQASADTGTITANWNQTQLGNANLDLGWKEWGISYIKNIKAEKASTTLTRVDNLGVTDTSQADVKIFHGRAYYKTTLYFWTDYTADQIGNIWELPVASRQAEWLDLITSRDFALCLTPGYEIHENEYVVQYSSKAIDGIKRGLDGSIRFDPVLKDLTPAQLSSQYGDIKITNTGFTSNVIEGYVTRSEIIPVKQYKSNVVQTGNTSINVDVTPAIDYSGPKASAGGAGNALESELKTINLGVARQPIVMHTLQQGKITIPAVGAETILTSGLQLAIIPDVKAIDCPLKVRYQQLAVDTESGLLMSPAGISRGRCGNLAETTIDRTVGYQVTNYCMRVDVCFVFDCFSTVKIEKVTEPGKPTPQPPTIQIEDYYWLDYLNGQTGAQIITDPSANWWDQIVAWFQAYYWVFIIIAVIIVLGVLSPYITPFIRRRSD